MAKYVLVLSQTVFILVCISVFTFLTQIPYSVFVEGNILCGHLPSPQAGALYCDENGNPIGTGGNGTLPSDCSNKPGTMFWPGGGCVPADCGSASQVGYKMTRDPQGNCVQKPKCDPGKAMSEDGNCKPCPAFSIKPPECGSPKISYSPPPGSTSDPNKNPSLNPDATSIIRDLNNARDIYNSPDHYPGQGLGPYQITFSSDGLTIYNKQPDGSTPATTVNENPLGLGTGDRPITCTYSQTNGWICK